MNVVIRLSDGVVVYATTAPIVLTDQYCRAGDGINLSLNAGNARALVLDTLPEGFAPQKYRIIDGEVLTNPAYAAPTVRVTPADIDRRRDVARVSGLTHGGHPYDTDEQSKRNLAATVAAVAAGVPLPDGFCWRSTDNVNVPMVAADVVALGAAMLAHENACYQRAWELKALAGNGEPFDIDAGWPA